MEYTTNASCNELQPVPRENGDPIVLMLVLTFCTLYMMFATCFGGAFPSGHTGTDALVLKQLGLCGGGCG